MRMDDTIVAVSSPPPGGPAGGGLRAILRLSGPAAWNLAASTLRSPPAALLPGIHTRLKLKTFPLPASLLLFQAPRSFTGDHLAELHLPASPALLRHLLSSLTAAEEDGGGARLAEPGEFSARAFFNGKIDLTQAEGIAATINAANLTQLRAAASLRSGDLHRWTAATADRLANLLAQIEAAIDFTEEEDIHFIAPAALTEQLHQLAARIQDQLESAIRIERLDTLPTVVFIGPPNVGKSSLINALTGRDRSIVSPLPGTTRDMLAVTLHTPAGDLRLIDVPGQEPPTDELRQKMMTARENALLDADLIIQVVAADDPKGAMPSGVGAPLGMFAPEPLEPSITPQFPAQTLTIHNKSDLLPHAPPSDWHSVSARTGRHIPELRTALSRLLAHHESSAATRPALNHRHRATLQSAQAALSRAAHLAADQTAHRHPELLAAELRLALDLLGQITGAISPDEILARIFRQFCIGK